MTNSANSDNTLSPEAKKHLYMFRKSLPMRIKLHEILRALGSTEGQTCLDIGTNNSMISYHLRRRGGNWHSAVTNQGARDSVRAVVEDNVHVLKEHTLPFDEKFFDAVVVVNFLEHVEVDNLFIEECHRILKSDGRLIILVAHMKLFTIIRPLRRMLGLTDERMGLSRRGYSESQLFGILKDGFDVYNLRSYSRFFIEIADIFVRFIARKITSGEGSSEKKVMRFYSIAMLVYWLADQLDILLFFTRGYYLVVSAKRRAWRPRKAPVLADGRSISEAVLSKIAK